MRWDPYQLHPRLSAQLNRDEYSAKLGDLLNIHINAGHALPADGAGGEGFDNAAETLFLSPIHAEKYLEAARQTLAYGARNPTNKLQRHYALPATKQSQLLIRRAPVL